MRFGPIRLVSAVRGLVRVDDRCGDTTACRHLEAVLGGPVTNGAQIALSASGIPGATTPAATARAARCIDIGLYRPLEGDGVLLRQFDLVRGAIPGDVDSAIGRRAVQVVDEQLSDYSLFSH